ncbi:uncharacterized protein LOC131668520 isoform X2 [Phymastichus coffea]|uniref:uncharacterized protein LOC131668520 isoform X2 n=1 Tax=Phymastichus coffea TaxID=108790 RepID=UPI00273AFE4A|nr:uncharacterized protein LOC131668520 isoform X2 [Phymastichus coffea]
MGSNAETKAKYESLVKSASALYLEKQFQKALFFYNDALKVVTESNMSKMVVCILKYMICCCLYESDKLEDMVEVVNMLQTMDRSIKNRFPALYCLLAQTHCKLFRFELAEMEFRNADLIFTKNPTLETFYIPGTKSPIRPTSKNDETWLKIKEECLAYHQPDAICSYPDCNYVAKPYVIPSKNIFLKDPAFNGMVIVNCNNKNQPCVLKFHQYCWKMKKDELYPISKVSDKDVLGDKCSTPNCLNGDTACVISSIQVIDQKGEIKAHIKENPSTTWPVKPQDKNDKNTSKGAIKKFKLNPTSKKSGNPISSDSIQQQLLDSLARSIATVPEAKDLCNKDDVHYYNESQIIVVKDTVVDVDFSNEISEVAGEKSFLLSFFIDYIKKNRVTIHDVYSKFNEYYQDLHLKDLDILGFLLQTNNFEILSNKDTSYNSDVCTEEIINQSNDNFKAQNFDDDSASYIDDVYYELMNDKDEVFVDSAENTEHIQNFNLQEPNFNINLSDNYKNHYDFKVDDFVHDIVDGNDVMEHTKNITNSFTPQSLESCAKFDFMQAPPNFSKGHENNQLKDYITKLESDMEKIIDENANLRKEIANKDSNIENFKKEYNSYQEKIKQCEQLFETMTDFQKGYDNMKEENFKTKEELVKVMKEKMDLEAKLEELEDPEAKRTEFMKLFQEEYILLQQAVNEEWESKTDILTKSLKAEIETKMALLNKLLNTQYSSNKHILAGYLDQCSDFVEITDKVNAWMEKTMNIKSFFDNSKWLTRLELLQAAANELKSEYSKVLNELHDDKEDKFKMTDINLKTPAIPNAPCEKLCDVVLSVLTTCCRHHYQMMQGYVLKAQAATQAATQAMQYQMHSAAQSQTYSPIQAGYVQQYPYAPVYTGGQSTVPTTPLVGISPIPIYHQTTPRTAGPPPNLTLQQAIPASQLPSLTTKSQASASVDDHKVEQAEPIGIEPSVSVKATVETPTSKDKDKENAIPDLEKLTKEGEKIDTFKDKLAQMREAFKTIALNVKEKSKSEKSTAEVEHKEMETAASESLVKDEQRNLEKSSENVIVPITKMANQVKDDKVDSAIKTVTNGYSIKDSVSIRDDRSDITTLTTRNDSKLQKKVGMDGLVKMLLKKFPGAMECDVIEAIAKIRKERNDALTGIPVSRIMEEAKPHIQQSQRLQHEAGVKM